MYEIDYSHDPNVMKINKLFNNIQKVRCDVEIFRAKRIAVDEDTIKAAQALARDIQMLRAAATEKETTA